VTLALCAVACAVSAANPACAAEGDPAPSVPKNPATAEELPRVVIIGTSPLPGIGLPPEQVPANVQTGSAAELKRQQSLDLTEFLNNNFSGVTVSESQGNPFQADVNYHGFTASPLLGTPQGLSVYLDGVRVNEAFGDTVNWDLIPEVAIATISLVSGSNPVFGLNTLGGALAVQTKSGHSFPGTAIEAYGGMFNRRGLQAETGGAAGNFDYFLAGNFFNETGWRDLSPSRVEQLFGKAGWQDDKTDIDVSYAWADTRLTGNGAAPESLLAVRRQAVFTAPDFTNNKLNFVNATGSHFLAGDLLISGNAYYRHLLTSTNNGDLNNNYLSAAYNGPLVDCNDLTSLADIAFCANGTNRTSALTQKTWGAGLQLTETRDLGTMQNQAVLGVSFDRSAVDYMQASQYAALTDSRQTVAIDAPGNPLQPVSSVGGISNMSGAYLSDTISPNKLFHVTAAARYNRIQETLNGFSVDTDLAGFGNGFGGASPLYGNHTYDRVNPSLGFTFTPDKRLTLYANYNESNRAPTVIELGCSDPTRPCGLPNAFASDPNLEQVISRTTEVGARGSQPGLFDWSLDLFRTNNTNDIQFVSTSTSQGYFANVGSTRRQGADFALGGRRAALTWRLVYSFVDATYRSSFLVSAQSNSTADAGGDIQVRPGDRIALIPRHTGRLRLDYALTEKWDIGGSVIVSSGAFLHGDENNANVANGSSFIGSGKIGGYSVVNLEATYTPLQMLDLFVKVVNLFDKHYATAGTLTTNAFNPGGTFRPDPHAWSNENFVSPAQPIALWAGIRLRLE
jgi:outer membrane receptor protein involved in Fe transport